MNIELANAILQNFFWFLGDCDGMMIAVFQIILYKATPSISQRLCVIAFCLPTIGCKIFVIENCAFLKSCSYYHKKLADTKFR